MVFVSREIGRMLRERTGEHVRAITRNPPGFHKILVTNKELKLFKIKNDDMCFLCRDLDSLENTFLECSLNVQLNQEILLWLNTLNNTCKNVSLEQIFL